MHCLKDLRIHQPSLHYSDRTPVHRLPTTFFANAPALRKLSLSNVLADFTQPLPQGLEVLKLSLAMLYSNQLLPSQLINLLQASSSSLKVLRLDGCLHSTEDFWLPLSNLTLPSLVELHLMESTPTPIPALASLLKSLHVSSLRRHVIACDVVPYDTSEDPAAVLSPVTRSVPSFLQQTPAFLGLKKLRIKIKNPIDCFDDLSIVGWLDLDAEDSDYCLSLTFYSSDGSSKQMFSMLHSRPFRNVVDLSVPLGTGLYIRISNWSDFASAFPNVTRFRLHLVVDDETPLRPFLEALAVPAKDVSTRSISSPSVQTQVAATDSEVQSLPPMCTSSALPMFPDLHRLEISASPMTRQARFKLRIYYGELRESLLSRSKVGIGIKALHLIIYPYAKLSPIDVAKSFRDVVPSVTATLREVS